MRLCFAVVAGTSVFMAEAIATAQPELQIGGFDASRGGEMSIETGPLIAGLRSAISTAFPGASFSGAPTLTPEYLDGKDAVLLSAVHSAQRVPIDSLSPDEQSALVQFVENGGTAILFADNDDFAPAAQSLLGPFGITVAGFFGDFYTATVDDPYAHPVTHGPYGVVNSMQVAICGELTDVGPDAEPLAVFTINNDPHIAGAVIDRGRLAAGSGLVLGCSDTSMVFDSLRSTDTTELVLNALYSARGCRADLTGDGVVDTLDFLLFLGAWSQGNPLADWDGNGAVNTLDFLAYLNDWSAGC